MTQGDPEVGDNNPINWALLKRAIGQPGKARLCGNLSRFEGHFKSVQTGKKYPLSCWSVWQSVLFSVWIVQQAEARIWERVFSSSIITIASLAWLWVQGNEEAEVRLDSSNRKKEESAEETYSFFNGFISINYKSQFNLYQL
jgi:hypothetical protein